MSIGVAISCVPSGVALSSMHLTHGLTGTLSDPWPGLTARTLQQNTQQSGYAAHNNTGPHPHLAAGAAESPTMNWGTFELGAALGTLGSQLGEAIQKAKHEVEATIDGFERGDDYSTLPSSNQWQKPTPAAAATGAGEACRML